MAVDVIRPDKVYKDDKGVEIIVKANRDLTGATSTKIAVRKPDLTDVEWEGSVYNIDGEPTGIRYVTVAGDLDQPGLFEMQALVQIGPFVGRGKTARLMVFEKFS